MTTDMQLLAARVERLERQNRQMKLAGISMLVVIGATLLMGQASPAGAEAEPGDLGNGKMFYINHGSTQEGIWRADLDGTNAERIISRFVLPDYPEYTFGAGSLAVDPQGGKLYFGGWGMVSNKSYVGRSNLDGSGIEILITGLSRLTQGIAVAVPTHARAPTFSVTGMLILAVLLLAMGGVVMRRWPGVV